MQLAQQHRLRKLAGELVRRAAPVVFTRAETAEQKSRIYAQRYRVVEDRGWGDRSLYKDGQEHDAYDDDAIQIQGVFGERLVASARIVFPHPDRLLPIERTHHVSLTDALSLDETEQCVEVGRTIVMGDDSRLPRNFLFAGLIASAIDQLLNTSPSRVVAVANRSMLRLYRRMGIEASVLGPPAASCGDTRLPVAINLRHSADAIARKLR